MISPSLSEAETLMVMLAGAEKIFPGAGLVMVALGRLFTVILTGLEVVTAPRLSVAQRQQSLRC